MLTNINNTLAMKLPKLTVSDIMTKKVVTVTPDTKINQISKLMDKHGIHGVPVVSGGTLAGIVTESDFFLHNATKMHIPSYFTFLTKAEFNKRLSKKEQAKAAQLLTATASDIMTKHCTTIRSDATLKQLLRTFSAKKIYTLPVVDKGKLAGVVTRADLVRLLA